MMHKWMMAVMLLLAALLFAGDGEDVLREISAVYGDVATFEARFEQTNRWEDLDRKMTATGVMYYDDERFIIRYDEPEGHILLATAEAIHMWDPASSRELIMSPQELEGRLRPVDIIEHYAEGATLEILDDGALLITASEEKDIAELRVEWDSAKHRMARFSYRDRDGGTVSYILLEQKLNKPLPDGAFQVELPEDREILDTRQ